MKSKKFLLGFLTVVSMSLTVVAETSTNAAPEAAKLAETTSAPPATTAPAPVIASDASAPAPAAAPAPAPEVAAAATPAPTPTPAPASAPAPDTSAPIPLIVMDEVALTDAIKNLARQAGLNYMLDPKINYNTPDDKGVVKPQPMVSLRWENITADQALTAVLNNYNLQILDDPRTHIARITMKDPAAAEPLVTRIIQLKYSDPTNIVSSVESVLSDKRSKVIADVRTSQLVLVATERELRDVEQMVARLDTQTKEVLIEAKIVELSKNPSTSKGVDWSGTLKNQTITAGNNVLGGQSTSPYSQAYSYSSHAYAGPGGTVLTNYDTTVTYGPNSTLNPVTRFLADSKHGINPSTLFLNADGVSAALSFLNTESGAKVLSTPRAVTLDNQEAILSVTRAQPIFKVTAATQNTPPSAEVLYTNLGTILHVTPRISANNTVSLKVVPEVSDVGGTITKVVAGLQTDADYFDIRKIETRVLIPSGHTLVMGGLVSDSITTGNTKVPFFGDIPVMGNLFRKDNKSQDKRNLIIFVTPTIVENEDFQPTQSTFLKTKVPENKGANFGAWDRGTPQDWSHLFNSKKKNPNEIDETELPTTN